MTTGYGHDDRREVQELNEDQHLLNALDNPIDCPDMTRSIMGKLGYMKAAPRVVRRNRIRRHVKRGLVGVAAFIALGVGIFIHNNGPDARRQVGPSLSEAVNHDILMQQQRIGNVIDTFRNFTPRNLTPATFIEQKPLPVETELTPDFSNEDDVPLFAKAPFRWM